MQQVEAPALEAAQLSPSKPDVATGEDKGLCGGRGRSRPTSRVPWPRGSASRCAQVAEASLPGRRPSDVAGILSRGHEPSEELIGPAHRGRRMTFSKSRYPRLHLDRLNCPEWHRPEGGEQQGAKIAVVAGAGACPLVERGRHSMLGPVGEGGPRERRIYPSAVSDESLLVLRGAHGASFFRMKVPTVCGRLHWSL